jgi:hypothetical protein
MEVFPMDEEKKRVSENLRTEYQEVCQNHRAITDFRAKLLTLLPLASGTGIFLLLTKQDEPLDPTHFLAIGLFGFLVTLGLFLHELRGIGHCGELIRLGRELEEKMGVGNGQFTLEDNYYHKQKWHRRIAHFIIGPEGAAWLIYPIVGLAWLYVAFLRFCWS